MASVSLRSILVKFCKTSSVYNDFEKCHDKRKIKELEDDKTLDIIKHKQTLNYKNNRMSCVFSAKNLKHLRCETFLTNLTIIK